MNDEKAIDALQMDNRALKAEVANLKLLIHAYEIQTSAYRGLREILLQRIASLLKELGREA